MWQGEYRGVPIALYSCCFRESAGASIGWVSVVLAVEETAILTPEIHRYARNYSGLPVARSLVRKVAEHRYPPTDVAVASIIRDPIHWSTGIGQIRVETKDRGVGRLAFRISAVKQSSWRTFDLENILKSEKLSGPKEIKPLPFDEYTADGFAKAMVSKIKMLLRAKERGSGGSLSSFDLIALAHPMWEDPSAIKALLTTAPAEELVYAIRFMGSRISKDQIYLRRIESIDSTLLGLANHESSEVRKSFSYLVGSSKFWPRDVHALEPLLESDDTEILSQVLLAFVLRNEVPENMERVRELAGSEDSGVRLHANSLLKLSESKNDL